MKLRISVACLIVSVFAAAPAAQADWASLLKSVGISKQTSINDTPVASGLKEALRVGIDKTVQTLGKQDGFLKNDAVKIMMPERLKKAEGLLRKTGFGPQMDELVLSMNRAAEKAAPQARDVFIDAIAGMSIEDADGILKGGDTAATDYFKKSSSAKLTESFRPTVRQAMSQYAVTNKYQALSEKFKTLPIAGKIPLPDVEGYVVQKTLDGLYSTLGKEEALIRKDPAARITPILKQVFSKS